MNDTIEHLKTLFVEQLHIDAPPAQTDLFVRAGRSTRSSWSSCWRSERQSGVQIATVDVDLDKLRTLEGDRRAGGVRGGPARTRRARSRAAAAMATIRSFAEDDIPAVAALFARAHPDQRWPRGAECEAYFREILLKPWRDLGLTLLGRGGEDGRMAGSAGGAAAHAVRGRPIRVAVGCQFMVDPDRRHGLTALQLGKAALSGPQDLFIADGANDLSRQVWAGLGGTAPLHYNLHWTRPLRPARYALALLEERGALPAASALPARLMSAAVDALTAKILRGRLDRATTPD
jgi:hypothetical protein